MVVIEVPLWKCAERLSNFYWKRSRNVEQFTNIEQYEKYPDFTIRGEKSAQQAHWVFRVRGGNIEARVQGDLWLFIGQPGQAMVEISHQNIESDARIKK